MAEGLRARGHVLEGLDDPYMDFGSGQFIWRLGDPAVDGYVSASDSRRATGWPPAFDCPAIAVTLRLKTTGVPCMASIGTKSYDAVVAQKVAFLGLGVMGLPMARPSGARRPPRHRL